MPFDTFIIELPFILGSLKILASLPTDPYFHPWHDGSPSYRISHGPYQPSLLGRNENRGFSAFARENFSGDRGEPGFPSFGTPQDKWYRLEQRSGGSRGSQRDLSVHVQPGSEGEGFQSFRQKSSTDEHLETMSHGNANLGAQGTGNSYSSHVNYEAENQKNGEVKNAPKTVRENVKFTLGSEASGKVDERINFKDLSRNLRTENSREFEVANSRIVTPKGGRRPPQGNSSKNQNKPFNAGATNIISSTEKTFNNQTTKGSKRPRPRPQGGDIVFPDGYPKKFVPRVAKCAKKSTFCEHIGEEYPSDYISQVLKKEGAVFKEFFGKDLISDPNITERINAPEENSLCPYRQEVVFPRAAQNKEDKWLFIINQDQYVQGVTVEVCLHPESRCILTENFPLGYTPYCKQKYIERRLVAIGEDGKPHSDSFRLPSCCSCVVKLDSSARMGLIRSSREVRAHTRH